MNTPAISVVIIGRNEGERLIRCIESVRAVDYPPQQLEIIYVDSRSTDGSPGRAADLGARVVSLDLERPTAAAGRNAGLAVAAHDLVQFLDGDTELHPAWLRQAVPAFDDAQTVCVFGRVVERHPERSIYNFWAHHDWHVEPGPAESCGGIAMFRRAALQRVDGYDATLTAGEERDLCWRLTRDGGRIECVAVEMVSHDIDITRFGQYWNRCRRVGHALAEVSTRYPDLQAWRTKCRRNAVHGLLALLAVVTSVALRSPWPLVIWLALVVLLIFRQARRMQGRIGSLATAFGYAGHHYIAKLPTLIGQIEFQVRAWTGKHRRATTYRDSGTRTA